VTRITDSQYLREMLANHYPGLNINDAAKASGQRVVYFCTFDDFVIEHPEGSRKMNWSSWGDVVVKVCNNPSANSIERLSKEITILQQLDSDSFPSLKYHETLTFDPTTEMPLDVRLLVTIEERILSTPLSECKDGFSKEPAVIKLLHSLITALTGLWNHQNKYVHRDLKPDNILIRPCKNPVIIDLGIVRETGQQGLTNTFQLMGPCTLMYASPEQITNDKLNISFKSDLFALGIITYELLSGQHPFFTQPPSSIEEAHSVLTTHIPPALKEIASVSQELSDIVSKLLANEPYKRYRKYQTVLDQLSLIEVR